MTKFQFFALLTGVALFLTKVALTYISNKEKPVSDRLPPQETLDSLLISTIFGLILSLMSTTVPDIQTSLANLDAKIENRSNELRTKIDTKFAYLNDMTQNEQLFKTASSLVEAQGKLTELRDSEVKALLEGQMSYVAGNFEHFLEDIKQYTAVIPREQIVAFAGSMFDTAKQTIDATSNVDVSWWKGTAGQKSNLHNKLALGRRVVINRIFILRDPSEISEMRQIMLDQKNAGVHVYILYSRERDKDVVILDNKLVGEMDVGDPDRAFGGARISGNPSDVEKIKAAWNDMIGIAQPF